jgi:hypothetical protein
MGPEHGSQNRRLVHVWFSSGSVGLTSDAVSGVQDLEHAQVGRTVDPALGTLFSHVEPIAAGRSRNTPRCPRFVWAAASAPAEVNASQAAQAPPKRAPRLGVELADHIT